MLRPPPPPAALAANLDRVRERIARATARSGRPPGAVRLVAVTKSVDAATAAALVDLGVRDLGENRVDALLEKQAALGARAADVAWHMVGHLQRNKAKRFLESGALLHSLESAALAEALAERLAKTRPPGDGPLRVLVEVSVAGEAQKDGVAPEGLADLLAAVRALKLLEVAGLMTMAPLDAPGERARPFFRALRELRDRHREHHPALVELSMGMTQDFEAAIEEGATIVRVGTALFESPGGGAA
jgi:hypothetical protein